MLSGVSKEDPKPGRWVLPIVIAVLIGFTYVFVNALPAADIAASTTTTVPATTTTVAQTTTSSTLPTDILAFLQELDRFENVANDLQIELEATSVPTVYLPAWPDTITASQDLVEQAQLAIDGLNAPDDGTLRREAVAEYAVKTTAFNDQLDVVRSLTP